jgi:predicted glycoside hydrolase/deacetylase ChbG (UPF0249 family)
LRRLIINADDFGFTQDVNAGIVHAHREGILTSTTLMANGDAFDDAVRCARENPSLDIGCHLVLVQGRSLVTGRPFPRGIRRLLPALARRRMDVETELRAQIEALLRAGIRPTHLDAHKHAHIVPSVFRIVARLAQEFAIPYIRIPLDAGWRLASLLARPKYERIARAHGLRVTDHFLGFRLTGSLTEAAFASALQSLPAGTTEFMCHPGFLGPDLAAADTRLKESRLVELQALTSPRIRSLLAELGIRLASFASPG